jgi:hypothetical protein
MMDMTTAKDQFVDSWLMISMNEPTVWDKWWNEAKKHDDAYPLAELLREEWDSIIDSVFTSNRRTLGEVIAWRVNEQLAGWGIEPFMIIARHLLERVAEDKAVGE